ncbi:MAG: hypothetical protein JXB30_16090 [Anaerolineae bacterium]|nr:hypothetical protein [Anaerolineae bacterium]
MTVFKGRIIVLYLVIGGLLLAACSPSATTAGEPRTWIDVPVNGLEVPEGQPVLIEGHAAHTAGVARVEFWFNGELGTTQEEPPAEGGLVYFAHTWTPPGPGDHTIQVVAIGADGSGSEPDSVRIHVGGQVAEVTPEITPTLVITPTGVITSTPTIPPPAEEPVVITPTYTPTIPPPPSPVIHFWVDAEVVDAGSCTTVHWNIENTETVASVVYDGALVGASASVSACPCTEETHTLTVNLFDGSREDRAITIHTNGTCAPADPPEPPESPADTEPPAAPVQLKPTNGQEFSCEPKVMLRWEAASDPSGIAEYRIQVERHSGDNNWQAVSGSPFQGLTMTQKELSIECGWYYRWRVLAVDGAGNVGPFSGWFLFTDWLM